MVNLKFLLNGHDFYQFAAGECLALGMAWHLDSGFFSILCNALLGWFYVGYKAAQFLWPG